MAKKKAEPKKRVRIHSCFDIEAGENIPSMCACNIYKTVKEAQGMVGRNEAEWVKSTDHRDACLIAGMARRTPRSATIDAKHIQRAFVDGDIEEKHRIEEYGVLNFAFLKSLKKPAFDISTRVRLRGVKFVEDKKLVAGIKKEDMKYEECTKIVGGTFEGPWLDETKSDSFQSWGIPAAAVQSECYYPVASSEPEKVRYLAFRLQLGDEFAELAFDTRGLPKEKL